MTPVTERRLPGRRAAMKVAAACNEQLMSSSPVRSETEGHGDSPFGDPSPSKGKTKVTYKGKGKSRSSPPKPKSLPVTPSTPKTSRRKRRLSPSSSDEDADPDSLIQLSLYGSLTPTTQTPSKKSRVQLSPESPSRVSRTHKEQGTTMSSPAHSSVGRGRKMVEEPWEAAKLGTFVWIPIDKRAKVAEVGDDDEDYPPDTMWWPARITSSSSSSVPLCLSLIGETTPRTESTLEIASPSQKNVLSMLDASGKLRFSETDFIVSPFYDQLQSSPRKKRKRDLTELESKWCTAVKDLVQQHDDENDGLPQAGEAYSSFYGAVSFSKRSSLSPGQTKKGAKGKRENLPSDLEHNEGMVVSAMEEWLPPPCDLTLTIPGELVLAREKKDSSIYWPAKIESYIPPDKPSKPGRYLIVFFDTVQAAIPRDLFFSSDEDGFGTCKLGQWESSYEDVLNDKESQQVGEDDMQDLVRSPSPLLALPSSSGKFCGLSIPQQFAYAKPVLIAILNEEYAPAKQRHSDFVKGGVLRRGVAENAGARGMMSPADVDELQRCLLKWALRDERRAQRMVEDETSGNRTLTLEDLTQSAETGDQARDSVSTKQQGISMTPIALVDAESDSEIVIPSSQPEVPPASSEPSTPPGTTGSIRELVMVSHPEDESSLSRQVNIVADRNGEEETAILVDGYRPPPRQHGCEAYEGLSGVERIEYCSNVLLPEAILQILLWRSGERSSVELLSPEEEAKLHEIGTHKLEETDWVHDVVRLREAKTRSLKKKASSLSISVAVGGTRSRPKHISLVRT